jgi:hypothetical protein
MDEAYKSFIMLGSAMSYAAILLGPWGGLKLQAYSVLTWGWLGYGFAFLGLNLAILPGLFFSLLKLNPKIASPRVGFTAFSTALIPLGLMFWLAFSLSFWHPMRLISQFSSDPLGWGMEHIRHSRAWAGSRSVDSLSAAPGASLAGGLAGRSTRDQDGQKANTSPLPAIVFVC